MIVEFFNNVADLATNALTEELNTSVKFGLVCPSHNGSHDDLDFELMKKSINSLYDGFVALVKVGFEFDAPLENLLNEARKVGLESEKAMFKAITLMDKDEFLTKYNAIYPVLTKLDGTALFFGNKIISNGHFLIQDHSLVLLILF